jgi:DMSO/TMAO reductase YedYZ heme-binding membrane subunit
MTSLPAQTSGTTMPWRIGGFVASLLVGLASGLVILAVARSVLAIVPLRDILAVYGDKTAWYLTRSTGTVAYLLLSGATLWGLVLSSKIVQKAVPAALALALHNSLAWLAVALAGFHVFVLLFDRYYVYQLSDLLLPFVGPYRPLWIGLGIIGFYLALLTSASFSWRKWLGPKHWRALHALTFVAYALVTVHGLTAGTDSQNPGMKAVYLGSSLMVCFLTHYRLLTASKRRSGERKAKPILAPAPPQHIP